MKPRSVWNKAPFIIINMQMQLQAKSINVNKVCIVMWAAQDE